MCGIAGSVRRRDVVAVEGVHAQLRLLEHRGPDASGVFAVGRGAVGQTRLAIIDLETGDPPVTDESGAIGVALNGEIYNFGALRRVLNAEGHSFRTRGDTEVVAHLAEIRQPVDVARQLHGMFAFAVWDAKRERLVLGRDRAGKKPLYYWSGSQELVFASEIKALLAHPAVPRNLDPDALPAYLTFGYVPSPRTMFEGIRSVPPGHVLVLERDWSLRVEAYWRPSAPGLDGVTRLDIGRREAADEVLRLLRAAVKRRLVADVPLGAFLSGGIDSSVIVGLMAELVDTPVRTFTIGFEDQDGFDERGYAETVARRFRTDHLEFVVKPEALDLIERLVWHHDQPFGDSSAIPTFLLSELTRNHVTVALSGDGGDELFAGYERFAAGVVTGRIAAVPAPLRRAVLRAGKLLPAHVLGGRGAKLHRFLDRAELGLPAAFREWISYVPQEWTRSLMPDGSRWAIEDYERRWRASEGSSLLDRLLLLNFETYLLDDLLPKVDRMAMAHGLEVRSPFLDHELIEFAFRLPPSLRARGLSLKRVLRDAVGGFLPPEILSRSKHGFGVPLDRWFRDDLSTYVNSMLGAPGARVRTWLDGPSIDLLLAEQAAGAARHGHALWSLLTLEVFLRAQDW